MAAGDQLIEHLLRRAGFGASSDELAAYSRLSYAQAVDRLVAYDVLPDTVDANLGKPGFVGTTSRGAFSPNTVPDDARQRWLLRMVHSDRPHTEDDVYAAARVFTGWNLNRPGNVQDPTGSFSFVYNANQHETTAKAFSFPIYSDGGHTIPSRSASAGMQDGLDFIAALSTHPETARRLVTKLYGFFVSETAAPDPAFINDLTTVYLQSGTAIKPVLQRLFTSPQFQDPAIFFTRYAWPAELVVRALKETGWSGFSVGTALAPLLNMGQELLEPPNVAGWVLGQNWFSTGAMLARMNFASALALNQKFNLAKAAAVAKSSPRALVDFLTAQMTAELENDVYSDLVGYAGAGGSWTGSDTQLQSKAPGVVHLLLGSAEYQFV